MTFRTIMNAGVAGLMLLIVGLVLANSNITVPPGGWLVACFLGAAAILVWGETFIKKQALVENAAKATRFAFTFTAVVVAGIGIYFTAMNYVSPGASLPTWLKDAIRDIGWFGVISLGVIALTLVFGIWRYSKIPGNASAYLFMGVVAFFIFFGGLYVAAMMIAPRETEMILGAAKNDIQGAAQGLVKTDPYGGKSIDWHTIVSVNWEKFFGILFFGICVIGFVAYVIKGHKLATTLFVVVAALTVLPTAFYLSMTYAVPEPVKEFVTGAATTVYEKNPFYGERENVRLTKADLGIEYAFELGTHDDLRVTVPMGDRDSRNGYQVCIDASADWKENHGHRPWFDHDHVIDITSDRRGVQITLKVTDSMKDGMNADNVTGVTYVISLIKVGASCLPQ